MRFIYIDPGRCQNETVKSSMKSVAAEPKPSPPKVKVTPAPVIPSYVDIYTRYFSNYFDLILT